MLLSRAVETRARLAQEGKLPPESYAENLASLKAAEKRPGLLKLDPDIAATLRGSLV